MKLTGKITKTISAAAIFAMFAVPSMAISASQGGFPTGKFLGNGTGGTVLLTRGGNGSGSGDQDQDLDQDQYRDGSCLDNATVTNDTTALILARNGSGSDDQDQDLDQDQYRDGSCES